jgi:hypothetical protein
MNEWRRIKKTRKPHKCACTGLLIPVGSSCWRFVGMYEGDFQSWHCTDQAKDFINKNYDLLCNGRDGYECQYVGELMREMGVLV